MGSASSEVWNFVLTVKVQWLGTVVHK